MPDQPLCEVFGFPFDDQSDQAVRHRKLKLCPFNNYTSNCTKDKVADPLGVCSIFNQDGKPVIVCPVRFREDWILVEHAARFFFGNETNWTVIPEVRLKEASGRSAGNIDYVLVSYDNDGAVTDFGALEVQAVYISGNVRNPFTALMNSDDPKSFQWLGEKNYPTPDFLSSSRKRLVPQLLYKGAILNSWKKRIVVAVDSAFFDTLPPLREVEESEAEIAWHVYSLQPEKARANNQLTPHKTLYTSFDECMAEITRPKIGPVNDFVGQLQAKLDKHLKHAPTTQPPGDILDSDR